MENYGQYYDLESYLFKSVGPSFRERGVLSAFDFFCIVIWKANRAKSKVAQRIVDSGSLTGESLNERIRCLTKTLFEKQTSKDRLRYLMSDLGFRLPMASAILTVLYPERFTVYDERVCKQLQRKEEHLRLVNKTSFEKVWAGYEAFRKEVEELHVPNVSELREKDRYLWGKSFHDQLTEDMKNGFIHRF